MLKNNKCANYEDYTTLPEESSDQLDTTLEMDELSKEYKSPAINSIEKTHLLYDICYHFQRTMTVKDSILFTLTIILCTTIISSVTLFFLDKKREYNTYYFTPDYKIYIYNYRDIIDTEEKLTAILMDSSIEKFFTPKKGDFITQRDTQVYLESYEYTSSRNDIYPLVNRQAVNFKNNKYEFVPSVITVSKKPMLAEKIKTAKVQNALFKNNSDTIDKDNIKIGSFVLVNLEGQYIVVLDNNISQEHLVDASKNKLIDINKLI